MMHESEYLNELQTLCEKNLASTSLSQPTRAMILATLQMTGGHTKELEEFLKHCDVVAIVKACQILDRPRWIKQVEQKIAKIEHDHPELLLAKAQEQLEKQAENEIDVHKFNCTKGRKSKQKSKRATTEDGDERDGEQTNKKRKRRIDVYRAEVKTAKSFLYGSPGPRKGAVTGPASSAAQEVIGSASLSGAFAKKVRRWAGTLKADFLEFIVMSGSMKLWKELADWVHFSPSDFALPYFLTVTHGGDLPEDSFVCGMRSLIDAPTEKLTEKFQALAEKHPQVYQAFNFLRMHDRLLRNKDIARLIATNVSISTVVWYLEEIAQSDQSMVHEIVAPRLETGAWMDENSKVTESFGKLLERILTFQSKGWTEVANALKPAAARRLSALKERWAPVNKNSSSERNNNEDGLTVIFGDKSASMQSAIEAATIIAAMVSTCFQGELSFFDCDPVNSPHKRPATVEDVLEIAHTIRAGSCTSMAAALWPYFETKQKISRIILVSDEGENTCYNSFMFTPLLEKYKKEVYDGVEVIFISVGSYNGLQQSLTRSLIDVKRIEIDGYRPDLSKFDSLLGQIALLSSY